MSALLAFFGASPARLQGLLVGGMAAAVLCLALLAWGLWQRGEALQARGERDLALAQADVLAAASEACSASVAQGKQLGDRALKTMAQLLAEARRLHAGGAETVGRLEDLLSRPAPAGAGCDDAWRELEALSGKAGAPR